MSGEKSVESEVRRCGLGVKKMKVGVGVLVLFGCVLVAGAEDAPGSTSGKVCEPGTEVTKACGVCKCNEEGTEYSCAKECPEGEKPAQATPANEEKCTPGEYFKTGCNECKCPESGLKSQAACTIIACPEE